VSFTLPQNAKNYIKVENNGVMSSNTLYISKFKMISKMPGQHAFGGVSGAYNDKIYVVGGFDFINTTFSGNIDVYNPADNSWNSIKTAEGKVFNTGQLVDGKIYLIGGKDANGDNLVIKYYDIENKDWKSSVSLEKEIDFPVSVEKNKKIYIVGGQDENRKTLNKMYIFDTVKETIINAKDMNTSRVLPAVCSFGNKIYVFGGIDNNKELNSSESYDIKTGEWNKIKDMPYTLWGANCVNINDEYIVIIGGISNNEYSSNIIKYYPKTDEYEILKDSVNSPVYPRMQESGKIMTVNNNEIYFFGGYNPYIYGTLTAEKTNIENFYTKSIDEDNGTSQENNTGSSQENSGGGGSAPLFDIFSLFLLIGGALLIFRRK
jgi:N-acetylneuraminic acid mutarotase